MPRNMTFDKCSNEFDVFQKYFSKICSTYCVLIFLYFNAKGEEGLLRRRDRPELFKSNILGRLPPLGSKSDIVTDLK